MPSLGRSREVEAVGGIPLVWQGVSQADINAFGERCYRAGRRAGYAEGADAMHGQVVRRLHELARRAGTSRGPATSGSVYRRALVHVRALKRPRLKRSDWRFD